MKKLLVVLFAGGVAVSTGLSQAADQIIDDSMGLSKTNVFDYPVPETFAYSDKDPSAAGVLPRAFSGAPPQIPHKTEQFMPITTNKNMCIVCHDKAGLMGKPTPKGIATPMPESHYNKVGERWERSNARFNCTQCHTPQANVTDLVDNTFKPQ